MVKKFLISLLCLSASMYSALMAASKVEMLQNVTTNNTIFPIYDKGKLVAILFGEEVKSAGKLIEVSGPMVDIAKNSLDINLVKVGKTDIYKLNSPLQEVIKFWKHRILFSDGVAVSTFAEVDQKARQAFGQNEIFFRSPALDIDGKGYHVNYKDSTILIRSDVNIVARSGASDVRKILENGKLPVENDLVHAKSGQLYLDLKKNYVELTENVEVHQPDGVIYCDKMVILLADNDDEKADSSFSMGSSSAKVSEIICSGNVRVVRSNVQKKNSNTVNFFSYMDNSEMVFCSEERKEKELQQVQFEATTIGAENLKWIFGKNLIIFEGKVEFRDKKNALDCEKLVLRLEKENGKSVIKEIYCRDKVYLRDDTTELFCEVLKIDFERVNGINEIAKASAYSQVKLINGKKDAPQKTEVTSDRGFLFFLENRAEFHKNVKVTDKDIILESDKLFLFAKKIPAGDVIKEQPKGVAPDRIKINDELELDRIEAHKNVVIERVRTGEENEKAYGDKAVYTVASKKIVLTGTEEQTPFITKGKNTLKTRANGRVIVDLNEESAYVDEGADLEIRDKGKLK
ncbi:MAG: hypothetical protein IKD09_05480 [Lentisphaeria bacterium]|nr:hypothetical protein [Lentisphaeria bacterium]